MTSKTRIILTGGFLGAGKTTLLLQAAEYLAAQGLRVGLVTNDQGEDLVDTALVHQHRLPVEEVAGGCFCCRFPDLLVAIRRLRTEIQPDVILAEPVGSCTDLIATVVRPIQQQHGDEFEIAPVTILLDPQRDLGHFPSTVTYLYRQQLSEAEIIALNKCDLLAEEDIREKIEVLQRVYPGAEVVALSARTGSGLKAWLQQSLTNLSEASQALDIDYAIYAEAEASLGWLNAKLHLKSTKGNSALSPERWITSTLEGLQRAFVEQRMSIAHVKLHLDAPGTCYKVSLTQMNAPVVWDLRRGDREVDQAEVILNARVNAIPAALRATIEQVVSDVCRHAQTHFEYTHFECFSPLAPQPTFRFS
jgi:G3E family GTPase